MHDMNISIIQMVRMQVINLQLTKVLIINELRLCVRINFAGT